jgi:putative aldouronate transport system permease protein
MGAAERLWDIGMASLLVIIGLIVLVPLWYVLMVSLTPLDALARTGGSLLILPSNVTFAAYQQLFSSWTIPRAFGVSTYITVVGTALNVIVTTLMAYPLARKGLPLRKTLLLFVLFTMLFDGGLIPTYLVVRNLGLLDTYWSLMLPGLINPFYLLVMKAFFQRLPEELEEAARIDGASDWQVLWRVVLPLSKPILATISLFYAVAHWNSYFDAVLYISSPEKEPLQVVLRGILTGATTNFADASSGLGAVSNEALQMAAVVLITLPVLVVYPFMQRYFAAGVLLGSIKD